MNNLQTQAAIHHLLSIGGSVAAIVAIFHPEWGTKMQVVIASLGTISASVGTILAVFSPLKQAAGSLTEHEATAVLNVASLEKAQNGKVQINGKNL